MTDLKGAEDLFWHLRVMGGGGGGEIGVEGIHSVASFSAFFFEVNEESLSTTVL